ncbi:acyltransferase family protein [Microbulbifer bruguierae]|uniref:Acyltransferase family protein n=1 Tax=Microbulbifer bruguierae TaxID=3029061 RepID=A0ABY8NI36_9GAMM|nr:acyltransferase family protein [Microbulbifer bruguierae]WGL17208.1 acyltransferase family protein [Microbulbifer bruguierae]
MTQPTAERRYDIDWLRTLAFAVLILYHLGMYYVADWGWHIKSEQTSVWLQNLMMLTAPWRMSLLFFVSAMALALAQNRPTLRSGLQQAGRRTRRLMVPLLFGMFVIVVPQVYFEALSQELIGPGYLRFWVQYINPRTDLLTDHHTPIGLLTWNHLWFLPYLWIYSLLLIALRGPLHLLAHSAVFQRVPPLIAITVVIGILAAVRLALHDQFPVTNALLDDWYNHGRYLLVFVFGYLFALQPRWWQFVIDRRRVFLCIAITCYGLIVAERNGAFGQLDAALAAHPVLDLLEGAVQALNLWAWIFAVVGFAGFHLYRPSALLSYTNTAILTWYMLHQTLIIVFAWSLKPLILPVGLEAPILLALTIAGCLLGYEIIRRVSVLRWLCGMDVSKGALQGDAKRERKGEDDDCRAVPAP